MRSQLREPTFARDNCCRTDCQSVPKRWSDWQSDLQLLLPCLLLSCIAIVGCGGPSAPNQAPRSAATLAPEIDNFVVAMGFFDRLDQFDPKESRLSVLHNLNRWIETQPPDPSWQPDPLVGQMPTKYRELEPIANLSELEFSMDDVLFLREVAWLKDVAHWASMPDHDENYARIIERATATLDDAQQKAFNSRRDKLVATVGVLHPTLADDEAARLAVAWRLFDWTVRNIQLDELLPYPKPEVAGPSLESGESEQLRNLPASARGVAGPGYQHYPWQVLMFGHGDAVERARVFIALARQAGIDVVMLGLDDGSPTSPIRPWCPAVFLHGQLFLFDMQLGLPIPAAAGFGIATLEQFIDDPALLRKLDVAPPDGDDSERIPYPVREPELKQVVALIDAAPQYLSQRMRLVERRLTGKRQMLVTQQPSALAARVDQCRGVGQVNLWTLPIETLLFRAAIQRSLATDFEALRRYFKEEGLFEGLHPLVRGRHEYLAGNFEADRDENDPGAKMYFLNARLSDELINDLATDRKVQQQLGLVRQSGEPEEQWQQRVESMKLLYSQAKIHAAYWLAAAQFETGNYAVALNWFARVKDTGGENPWTAGARYNLARSYEALGQWDEAYELYTIDDSPQSVGNWLRARLLSQPKPPAN